MGGPVTAYHGNKRVHPMPQQYTSQRDESMKTGSKLHQRAIGQCANDCLISAMGNVE